MTRKRRNHSPEFKAKVALAAAKGDKTVAELAQKYNLHANQISTWKKELLENAAMIFASESQLSKDNTEEVDKLHAKIGQLTNFGMKLVHFFGVIFAQLAFRSKNHSCIF